MSSHGSGGSSLGQASTTSSISDPLLDDHEHDGGSSRGSIRDDNLAEEEEDPSIGVPSTITSERESLLSVRSGSADDSSSALSRRSSRSSSSRSSRTASSLSDRIESLHASQGSLRDSQSSLLKRLGIQRDDDGNVIGTTTTGGAAGSKPTTPPDAHSFAPVSSAIVQDSTGAAISTNAPAAGGTAASTSTAGGASFGGGRGWEGWDREEGHRALGQSYQRHAMVLREADAGSVHTDPDNPYDVDEFGSVSMGGSRNSSSQIGTGGSSSGSHSGSYSRTTTSRDKITSSGSGSGSSYVHHKHSTSSGKSTATSGSRSTDPTRIFGKLIRPSREGLAAQTIMAKRRHSLRTMGRENFLSSMEQGDHLEKRRMASASSGTGSKLGYGLDDYDADGRPTKFPRLSTMKMVCTSVAVISALTCGVVLLALPQSGPATAIKDAYTSGEETVRSIVFRSRTKPATVSVSIGVDAAAETAADVVESSSGGQREIEDITEKTAVEAEDQRQDDAKEIADSGMNPDSTRTLNMLVPLTDYNTAHSIEEEGIYIPHSSSEHLANIWDEFLPTDVPLYWDGQFSAGYAMSRILGRCYGMSLATTHGELENIKRDMMGRPDIVEGDGDLVKYLPFGHDFRPKGSGVDSIGDGSAGVLLTDQLHDVSDLFDPSHRGRVFSILQHPFTRELSKYKYLASTQAIPEDMTFLDWINFGKETTPFERHNSLVRVLTNEPMKSLTGESVDAAKEVIRRKLIIGFTDKLDESFRRFAQYFGWRLEGEALDCVQHFRRYAGHAVPNDVEAAALARTQWADIQLYEYALGIFEEQSVLIEDAQALRTKTA